MSELAHYQTKALEMIKDAFAHNALTTEELERRTEMIENATSLEEIESSVRDLTVIPASGPVDRPQTAISCILGERAIKRDLASFQDTPVKVIMGETRIDARADQTGSIRAASGSLQVLVVMGSVEITVPRHTVVDTEIVPIMGSIEERGKQTRSLTPPHLRLTGKVIMGEVTIRRRD